MEVKMPKLGETMLEGVITRWLKKQGDEVSRGEVLVEVETDKAISEVTAPSSGMLERILAAEGIAVKVGDAFALLAVEGEAVAPEVASPQAAATASVPAPSHDVARNAVQELAPNLAPVARAGRVLATPAAKRLAREKGVALESIAGTGPDGAITERDVETASSPSPEVKDAEIVDLVGARKVIAERMLESRQKTAHVTTFTDVNVTRIGELRKGIGATYTAFVVKAVASALPNYPYVNSSIQGNRILLWKRVHMGVAVAAGETLLVPVIRDADRKSLRAISEELSILAEKGRNRQLTSEEMQGATFTISNAGVFGALFTTPIINLPQSGILGTGRCQPSCRW